MCLSELEAVREGGEWRVGECLLVASCCHDQYMHAFPCVIAPSPAFPLANSGQTPTPPRPHAQPQILWPVGSSLKGLRQTMA
jgi:hypothetical protein